MWNLPAVVNPETAQVIMRAGSIVGFMLPADLGEKVQAALEQDGQPSAPILAHARSGTWTVLAQRDVSTADILASTFSWWSHRVLVLTENMVIALPRGGVAEREWIVAPSDGTRPAASAVIAALSSLVRKDTRR